MSNTYTEKKIYRKITFVFPSMILLILLLIFSVQEGYMFFMLVGLVGLFGGLFFIFFLGYSLGWEHKRISIFEEEEE